MVCRRRWRNWTVMLVMAAMPTALALGAIPTAQDFEAAPTKELPGLRDQILKAAPAGAQAKAAYALATGKDFTSPDLGINSKRPEVRLNSAILIYDLNSSGTERAMILMLQNDDAAVRYWGAKGLGNISSSLQKAGAAGNSIKALRDAGGKPELSGIVEQELIKALAKFNDLPALVDVLTAAGNQMAGAIPDGSMLQSVAMGLDSVAQGMPSASAADKIKAATAAARAASFAAQQQINSLAAIQAIDKTGTVPAEYSAAVHKVIEAAVRVINGMATKTYQTPRSDIVDPGELLMNVNQVFGTSGGKVGELQTDFKSIPIPPAVKTGQ